MNICVLAHSFPRTANDPVSPFMEGFCDGLIKNGANVWVLVPHDPMLSRHGDKFKITSYKYIWPEKLNVLGYSRMMEADVKLRWWAYLLLPAMLVFGTFRLLQLVRKEKIDIISVHWILPNGVIAFIVSKLTGLPYVVSFPGTDIFLANKNKLFSWVARVVAQNSKGLVTSNTRLMNEGLKVGVKGVRTELIPYPADISEIRPFKRGLGRYREKHEIERDDLVVLAIGRFVFKKGFRYLIQAMDVVVKKNRRVKLLLVGDGDLQGELEAIVEKLDLKENVIFTGRISTDELVYYYNLAEAVVIPSVIDKKGNFDGATVASAQAMACGKPLIISDIVGLEEVFVEGVHGMLVPEKNSVKLAAAILKMMQSETQRTKMGDNNIKLAKSVFSTGAVGKKYKEMYEDILKNEQ